MLLLKLKDDSKTSVKFKLSLSLFRLDCAHIAYEEAIAMCVKVLVLEYIVISKFAFAFEVLKHCWFGLIFRVALLFS